MNPGEMITPTLRLVRPLAAGSMGSVWVAYHTGLLTEVAVKFISGPLARDPSFVARFEREAQASSQIKSVHVVQVFDRGSAPNGDPYIVMELLSGQSLKERIERAGALSVRETAAILRQLAKPVAKAHALGIIHRDIKTANIFLMDSDGDLLVKLLDFGVVKIEGAVTDMTRTGDRLGTPYYMAPEQLLSAKHVDRRADLWSIGVVAYFCLLARPPFPANTFVELVLTVSKGLFLLPGQVMPGAFSPAIDAWFRRALTKAPEGRFADAREMADAFERAAGSM